jgi:adenosylhomocysteine nucleosidase
MLMIAAALEEELEIAKSLCGNIAKIENDKARLWQAVRNNTPILFVRTGVGPRRSAARLREAFGVVRPSEILMIGYAGALDPGLKLGSVVAVERAVGLSEDPPGWENVRVEGEFELAGCPAFHQAAAAAGLRAHTGTVLTSFHVLGHPVHKRLLYEKFGAAIVDMETAALARVAQSEGIPLSCIRVVSDESEDNFLAPFSYDPTIGVPARAKQLMETGMRQTYRQWKTNSSTARECLGRFLSRYL